MKCPHKQKRPTIYPAGTSRTTVEWKKRLDEKKKGLPKRTKPKSYKPKGVSGSKDRKLR